MRVPVILRVYTSLLVPVAGCGRFWAGLVALENNENSKGSFFYPLGPGYANTPETRWYYVLSVLKFILYNTAMYYLSVQ